MQVRFTDHAVARYRERLRPTLTTEAARLELSKIAPLGEIRPNPPAWCTRDEAETWLVIESSDVVFPLHRGSGPTPWVAATCLTREIPPKRKTPRRKHFGDRRFNEPRQARPAGRRRALRDNPDR